MRNAIKALAQLSFVLVLAALAGGPAAAQVDLTPTEGLEMLLSNLDLSLGQQKALGAVFEARRPTMNERFKTATAAQEALDSAIHSDTTADADIRQAADTLGQSIGDLSVLRAKLEREVAALLTNDQKAQILGILAERAQIMTNRFDQLN